MLFLQVADDEFYKVPWTEALDLVRARRVLVRLQPPSHPSSHWDSVLDPDPDDPYYFGHPNPLVRGTDPDPSSKNSKKIIDFYCFVTYLWLFIFLKMM
jgi:hypothetical protein